MIEIKNEINLLSNYTGIIEWEKGDKIWFKNGFRHREDGPAHIEPNGYKAWYLDGKFICSSTHKFKFSNRIILSKSQHPEYPLVQVWKILGSNGLYEQLVIPGMEEFISD